MFNDDERKYIDIIESIITRMSDNSKQMKEWCIALVTGLIGISFSIKVFWLSIIALPVVVVFLYLDAFYLQLERCFRHLYDAFIDACKGENHTSKNALLYSTSIGEYMKKEPLGNVCQSPSIKHFYLGMILGVVVLSAASFAVELNDEEKIKLTNESFSLKVSNPLDVRMKNFDSLKIDINKIDSLIVKIDELKKINLQIIDTVKVDNFVKRVK
jgi:hypothetical protein